MQKLRRYFLADDDEEVSFSDWFYVTLIPGTTLICLIAILPKLL